MLNTVFCSNRRTYFQKLDQHRKTNSSNIRNQSSNTFAPYHLQIKHKYHISIMKQVHKIFYIYAHITKLYLHPNSMFY